MPEVKISRVHILKNLYSKFFFKELNDLAALGLNSIAAFPCLLNTEANCHLPFIIIFVYHCFSSTKKYFSGSTSLSKLGKWKIDHRDLVFKEEKGRKHISLKFKNVPMHSKYSHSTSFICMSYLELVGIWVCYPWGGERRDQAWAISVFRCQVEEG